MSVNEHKKIRHTAGFAKPDMSVTSKHVRGYLLNCYKALVNIKSSRRE